MLSTKVENSISLYLKMHVMPVDNSENIEKITAKSMKLGKTISLIQMVKIHVLY